MTIQSLPLLNLKRLLTCLNRDTDLDFIHHIQHRPPELRLGLELLPSIMEMVQTKILEPNTSTRFVPDEPWVDRNLQLAY